MFFFFFKFLLILIKREGKTSSSKRLSLIKFTHFRYISSSCCEILNYIKHFENELRNFLFNRKFLSSLFNERHLPVTEAILIFPIDESNLWRLPRVHFWFRRYLITISSQVCLDYIKNVLLPLRTFLSSLSLCLFFSFFKRKDQEVYVLDRSFIMHRSARASLAECN